MTKKKKPNSNESINLQKKTIEELKNNSRSKLGSKRYFPTYVLQKKTLI